jgi:coenzyme F420-0:L-glutamate ligase/coenzyme F420-1:gamma-L-glutamate ligase
LIQILPVAIPDDIRHKDNLAALIVAAAELQNNDILVVAQKIVSKSEGQVVDLASIKPSRKALRMAKVHRKDPRLVEVILRESRKVVRARNGVLITETHHGFVCANAAVDQSNVKGESQALLLPVDPDKSASKIKKEVLRLTGKNVAVVVADTFGRPFRNGQTNVAIGISGIQPIKSYVGTKDMYGKKLRVTEIAVADEIASAAELVMGKAIRVPAAIVRGYKFKSVSRPSTQSLVRNKARDLFR